MTDLRLREPSLMMGMGILLAAVTILFFGVTMAAQQVAQRKALLKHLREQFVRAEQQARERLPPDEQESVLEAAREAAQLFVTPESLPAVQAQLTGVAEASQVKITFMPLLAPSPPTECLPGFEQCYQVLPLVATVEARYRELAIFLKRALASTTPLTALRACTVTPMASSGNGLRLKARVVLETFLWTPGALPERSAPTGMPAPSPGAPAEGPAPKPSVARDPFDPEWRGPPSAEGITVSGILWDPYRPTCVLNRAVVGMGDVVHGYTVAAILPGAVLLRATAAQPDRRRELILSP